LDILVDYYKQFGFEKDKKGYQAEGFYDMVH